VAAAGGAAGLIDTDILINAARGLADGRAFLAAQRLASGIQISIISAMELVVGCRDGAELAGVQQFLQQVTVLPVGPTISQDAYHLIETFFLSHGLLIPDALIAATALEHGLTLFTRNIRHFQMIPMLTVSRPY
jgi:predicted nucleic acid-binding protein